jgi:hypothetical protein
MKDIMISILLLTIITTIARIVLPKFEVFVQWLIKRLVNFAEKKVKGSGMGEDKKVKVLKWLKWFGIKSSSIVDTLIDSAVDVMNSKGCDITSNVQNDIGDKVVNKLEDTTKKIIK